MNIPSYMTDLSWAFGLSSAYEAEFRAYLKLAAGQAIPDDSFTEDQYIKFLSSQESSLAGYIVAAIQQYYGSSADIDELALLDEFRASMGLSASDPIPDTAETRRQFVYFLKSPLTLAAQGIYGISSAAADSLRTFRQQNGGSPIGDSDTTLAAYLSSLTPGTTPQTSILTFIGDSLSAFNNTQVTNATLAKFRAYLGLSSSQSIANDSATRTAFLSFMKEALALVQKSEAVNALSPQEEQIRNIFFSTYAIIVKMLSVLQKATQVESKSQQVYADWMSNLTAQISATPLYGPKDENMIIANSADFGRTTLGYGNITVRDVLNYLMNQIQTAGTDNASFTVRNPIVQNLTAFYTSPDNGFPKFDLTKNSDGSFTFKVEAPILDPYFQILLGWETVDGLSFTISPTGLITNQTAINAVVDGLLSQMTQYWNSQSTIVTPTLVLWLPERNSDGQIDTSSWTYVKLPIDLKEAWGTSGATQVVYREISFGDRGWDEQYALWEAEGGGVITVVPNGTISSALDEHSLVQYLISTMTTNHLQTYYWTVGTITDASDSPNLVLKLVQNGVGSSSFTLYWAESTQTPYGASGPTDVSGWNTFKQFTEEVVHLPEGSGMWGPWQEAWPQTIAYPSGYNAASLQTIEANSQTYRGEVNAQLQLYLQSTQARQSTIETSMKNMQNLVSQTTQAVTNQTNLLDNIIQAMTAILSTLFH
jgi:hypothetical protein